ncbi:acetylornithine deacetylase [Mesorhizobium marinum]|uniref:acetylornithine deacetylase n=1 Tax=Mesorhizobium marinum TaxID=3228790 RepID=UPI0034652F7C
MPSDTLSRTREILADLIAFPTVSADSNLALIDYAAGRLRQAGATCMVTRDPSGTKANLFATLGPRADGGIVLSGHADVVPVEGQDWATDPFRMVERDGRLYGRGACDMKGFIAACLAVAPEFDGTALRRPLHFAITYDEEVGCLGARALVQELARSGIRPSVAIIGEPTEMRVIEGHKGCYEYTTEFVGLEGHGSQPELGVNAVEYAVRYVSRLLEIREGMKDRAPVDSRFVPPWTTLQVGCFNGGAARNVIAGHCAVEWEFRPVQAPDVDFIKTAMARHEEELRREMKSISPGADIVTHTIGEVEGLAVVEQSEARDIVNELTGANHADVVAFGTEAGLFQQAGMSAVICGPGSIAQAHKPDEYVEIGQLASCISMLDGLRRKLTA